MDFLAVSLAALALILSSFIKETYLNVIVYISVGFILLVFGFVYPKPLTKLILRVLLGILIIVFTFVKSAVAFGTLHSIVSVIISVLSLASIFIKDRK